MTSKKSSREIRIKTPELGEMDDDDEIIDLGDERDQVLAKMKQSLEGRQGTSGHDASQSTKQDNWKAGQAETEELYFSLLEYFELED